tara:strand:- start:42 stop:584 length:543 start_codon:yes stop_codon:yes gene_type:complete
MSAKKIREWAWPYIKNFRTYIDIGALDGDTAKPFVDNFEKIIAFEPNPEVFKMIPESIEKYNVGLGDQTETRNLILPDNGLNLAAHGSVTRYSTGIKTFPVNIKTLDSYNFKNIDFVKIDVEHFELQVCKGAENTFKKYMPTIMFENKRNEANDCKQYLKTLGYTTKEYKSETVAYISNR